MQPTPTHVLLCVLSLYTIHMLCNPLPYTLSCVYICTLYTTIFYLAIWILANVQLWGPSARQARVYICEFTFVYRA